MDIKRAGYLLMAILISGCASITGSKNQPVSVTSSCSGRSLIGANCILTNDKGQWFVTTPGSVVVSRSSQDIALACKKDKLAATTVYKSNSNGGIWGNILAGGLIGYAVDAGGGAGFDYPAMMNVNFTSCR